MVINDAIKWYKNNVDHEVNEPFIKHMIGLGILNDGINLELLNSFMLESDGDDYAKNNCGKYKMKPIRIPLVNSFITEVKSEPLIYNKQKPETKKENIIPNLNGKFKLQRVNGNKLKLIRL